MSKIAYQRADPRCPRLSCAGAPKIWPDPPWWLAPFDGPRLAEDETSMTTANDLAYAAP